MILTFESMYGDVVSGTINPTLCAIPNQDNQKLFQYIYSTLEKKDTL